MTERSERINAYIHGNTVLLQNEHGKYAFGCEAHVTLGGEPNSRIQSIIPKESGIQTVTFVSFVPFDAMNSADPRQDHASHDYLTHLMIPPSQRRDEVNSTTRYVFRNREQTLEYIIASRMLLWGSSRQAFKDVLTDSGTTGSRLVVINAHGGYDRGKWVLCDGLGFMNTKRKIGSLLKKAQTLGIQTQPVRSWDLAECNAIGVETVLRSYVQDYPDTASVLLLACNRERQDLVDSYPVPIFYIHGVTNNTTGPDGMHPAENSVILQNGGQRFEFGPQLIQDETRSIYW